VKRFILVLVVLAGGLAWAALAIPSNAATVNGATISQSHLNSDLNAIANSRDYQCFLNAEQYVGSDGEGTLPPLNGSGQALGSGSHPTATTAFVSQYLGTEIGHQILLNEAAKRHVAVTPGDIASAKAQFSAEITQTMSEVAQVQDDSITCGPGPTLTGKEVLATLPSSFVDQSAEFDATVAALEDVLAGANTTAGLVKYFDANRSAFDTACFTVAQYSSQNDAEAAIKKVSAGTPFAQVATTSPAASGGGPAGCDILYGISAQFPSGTNLQALKIDEVSKPISVDGTYLLVQITSRTPTAFAKAESTVREAAAQTGATEARGLLDEVEQHSSISVNPKYGTWTPANAQVLVPNPPPAGDVLNASANEPVATPASAPVPAGTTPSSGQSG